MLCKMTPVAVKSSWQGLTWQRVRRRAQGMNMLPVRLLHLLLLAATASSALAYPIRTSWVDPADLPPSRMGHYRDHHAYLRRQSPEHRQALRQRSAVKAEALRDAQQHERQGRSLQFTAAQGPLAIKFLIDQASFASELTPEGAAAVEAALPDVAAIASQILQARNPPPKPLLIMPACIFYVYGTDTSDGKDICIAPWFSADLSLTLSGGACWSSPPGGCSGAQHVP